MDELGKLTPPTTPKNDVGHTCLSHLKLLGVVVLRPDLDGLSSLRFLGPQVPVLIQRMNSSYTMDCVTGTVAYGVGYWLTYDKQP